ncbi:hypothetical protein [Sutcliffiella deserti]|nr:hypothetical protein [Sutcliffiella deserti]
MKIGSWKTGNSKVLDESVWLLDELGKVLGEIELVLDEQPYVVR